MTTKARLTIGAAKIRRAEKRLAALRSENEKIIGKIHEIDLQFIGQFVIEWSDIEFELDGLIDIIHVCWGKEHIQPNIPPSLDRELDYIKSAVAEWDFLREFKDDLRSVLTGINAAKTFRHNIVHGRYDLLSNSKTLETVLAKAKGDRRTKQKTVYPRQTLLKELHKSYEILQELRPVMSRVRQKFISVYKKPS